MSENEGENSTPKVVSQGILRKCLQRIDINDPQEKLDESYRRERKLLDTTLAGREAKLRYL